MINSESAPTTTEAVADVVRSGMPGAFAVAGIATAVVIGLWIAFYLLVFVPRGPIP